VLEWPNRHAWRACVASRYRGFESHPLRQLFPPGKMYKLNNIYSRYPFRDFLLFHLISITIFISIFSLSCITTVTSPIAEIAEQIEEDLPLYPSGETTTASVIRIIDGDTIEVEQYGIQYKVRYIGVDTPESDEPGYDEAADANSDLVWGKDVTLEKDVSETDRYGRLLRYVWVDGYMVNAILIGTGYAEAVEYKPDIYYADNFNILEIYAQNNLSGLWKYQVFDR
jgi:endonuclease YncB( thermonuclease family)